MNSSEKIKEFQNLAESALPIHHYEVLLTKFLDHSGSESKEDLVLNQVKIFIFTFSPIAV
jgi:hypothetical protein